MRLDNGMLEVVHSLGSVAESTQTRTRHQHRALERNAGPSYMAPIGRLEGVLLLDHTMASPSNVWEPDSSSANASWLVAWATCQESSGLGVPNLIGFAPAFTRR